MKKRKLLVSALAIALAAIICIGGTLAYFTDITDQKDNLFSVAGQSGDDIFNIDLTEPNWDAYEKDENGEAVVKPGITIPKDPTVTLTNDAYDYGAYVQIEVRVTGIPSIKGKMDAYRFKSCLKGLIGNPSGNYSYGPDGSNEDVLKFTYRNPTPIKKGESITLFTGVEIPANLTAEELALWNDLKISVRAYAVSAEGLTEQKAVTPLNELAAANPIV